MALESYSVYMCGLMRGEGVLIYCYVYVLYNRYVYIYIYIYIYVYIYIYMYIYKYKYIYKDFPKECLEKFLIYIYTLNIL